MTPDLREQLIGYLLGALEDDELEAVRRQLEEEPTLRDELERLQLSLAPLSELSDVDPPEGLVEQTCASIDAFEESEKVTLAASHLAASHLAASQMAGGSREMSRARANLADFVVAAGIFLAAALLFFPAITNSRYLARRIACQNNLRQTGLALADYSDKAGLGFFPGVPLSGKRAFAGIYAPILQDGGYLLDARIVLCPAAELTESKVEFGIPTLAEIDGAEDEQWLRLRQLAGGSYGYNLGMVVNRQHVPPRNLGRSYFALAGDAAPVTQVSYGEGHHGGRGQNLLFEDGHVRYVVVASEGGVDDPFRNRMGIIEAGFGVDDAVIAPSFYPPFMTVPNHRLVTDQL